MVAAIAAERAHAGSRGRDRRPRSIKRAGWHRRFALGAGAAAAAILVAAVAVAPDDAPVRDARGRPRSDRAGARRATARRRFTRTDSGWRVELDATGLPRLDDGRFYQAWLKGDDDVLVAIGSFNEGEDVVLWAGVSPVDYPTITITEETTDGDPSSSGRRVLVGPIDAPDVP